MYNSKIANCCFGHCTNVTARMPVVGMWGRGRKQIGATRVLLKEELEWHRYHHLSRTIVRISYRVRNSIIKNLCPEHMPCARLIENGISSFFAFCHMSPVYATLNCGWTNSYDE